MSAPRVRVLVAENHPLFRQAVAAALARDPRLDVVAQEADGRAALDSVRELTPDVAVLDMRMPELDGMQVLNAIVRDGLETRVLFVSARYDGGTVYAAVGGGAAGYLSKDASAKAVVEAVVAVARGETVIPRDLHGGIAAEIRARSTQERPLLTDREREILRLAGTGHSAPQMARVLHLSPGTVKSHLQGLYGKLGVSDRAAAVAEAMRRGLLE